MSRSDFTSLTDAQLLAQCDVDTYRASGPGGQKRNKTSSAVRLRHAPTGLLVIAEESRSQHANKAKAVRRLYRALFLDLRDPPPADPATDPEIVAATHNNRLDVSAKDPRFWPAAGVVLDVLLASGGEVSTAAAALGLTTANLVAFLGTDPKLWQTANRLRLAAGLKALSM